MITLHVDGEQLQYLIGAVERDIEDMEDQGLAEDLKVAAPVLRLLQVAEQTQAIPF